MPTPAPIGQTPNAPVLARMITAAPVAAAHMQRWCNDLNWLNGYVMRTVVSQTLYPPAAHSQTIKWAYRKTPAAQILGITIEPHIAGNAGAAGTFHVTTSGTITWLGGDAFDGTISISVPNLVNRDNAQITKYIDVSQLTNGTSYDFSGAWADVGGNNTQGVRLLNVIEMSLADCDPIDAPTVEIGENPAAFLSRSPIVDGATNIPVGMQRVLQQFEIGRYQDYRQGMGISAPGEDTTNAWQVTDHSGTPVAIPFNVNITNPLFRTCPRNLYGNATNTHRLVIRYMNSSTQTLTIRVQVGKVGGGTTNYDRVLPNSATWTEDTALVLPFPTTGTGGECTWQYFATQSAAGTSYVSLLCPQENEV